MDAAAVTEKARYVETRMMIGGQIVAVGGWFSPWIDEGKAIQAIRARYDQKPVDTRRVRQVRNEEFENETSTN